MFGILLDVLIGLFITSLVVPLPINDKNTVRYNTLPWMTFLLILVNCVVFLAVQSPDYLVANEQPYTRAGIDAQYNYWHTIYTYGFQVSHLKYGVSIGAFTTITSTFMHIDFEHLVSNMIFLWAFGRRVEDACGAWRFLMFYLLAGISAAMGFAIFASEAADLPGVGASGAIYGVIGAYMLLFSGAQMTCLWSVAVIWRRLIRLILGTDETFSYFVDVPAYLVIIPYIGINVLPTFYTATTGEMDGGINYVAHMIGFLSAVTIFLFVRKDLFNRYISGRSL